jgi:hypothetical protein
MVVGSLTCPLALAQSTVEPARGAAIATSNQRAGSRSFGRELHRVRVAVLILCDSSVILGPLRSERSLPLAGARKCRASNRANGWRCGRRPPAGARKSGKSEYAANRVEGRFYINLVPVRQLPLADLEIDLHLTQPRARVALAGPGVTRHVGCVVSNSD